MKKSVKILFTGSVLLNVVFLGLIGGHFYHMMADHPWNEVREELAPESQNHVARTFQNAFRAIREEGDKARKSRAALVQIISAKDFDAKAFDKVAAELAESKERITVIKMNATKEVAAQLSQEERAKMAQRMTRMIGGGWEVRVHRERRPHGMAPPPGGPKPPPPGEE